jgi:signal transduction histidine kinase/CheY-like chemotaxis protein
VLRPLDGVVAAIRANDAAPAPATEELGLVAAAYNMNRASAIASGAAMKRALVKIEEASHAKSAFLANMSHEIRTPMTAILGYLEVLGERMVSDPAEASEMMRAVRSNGDLLMAIINDILDVSRIEAQQLTVERIETDPSRAVLDTAALMGPIAAERGVGLRVEQATPIPERIVSDPTRLRQIVNNLVSNAVKFTEEGRVTIRLACDPGRERLSIAVADTGCGMTPEQREAIGRFRPFTQADASVARRHGGSGLGLCIANGLAERLGGGIRIESEAGRGSTFTVAIGTGPLDGVPMRAGTAVERPPAPDAPAGPVKAGACLRGARIEVVDDGPDNRRLLRFLLERAGAGVVLHENGQRALDALDPGDPPDLVLMDMQMPEVDGYAATRELRARGFVCPIVAVTAHAMAGDREGCLEAGCDDYLSKPIDRAGLYETCERWIGVGLRRAAIIGAVRTPIGRYAGALAAVRPTTSPPVSSGGRRPVGDRPGAHRRRVLSAPPTSRARTTATSPGWRPCSRGSPSPSRARPSTGSAPRARSGQHRGAVRSRPATAMSSSRGASSR